MRSTCLKPTLMLLIGFVFGVGITFALLDHDLRDAYEVVANATVYVEAAAQVYYGSYSPTLDLPPREGDVPTNYFLDAAEQVRYNARVAERRLP